ncbi:hypothetical protein K402DRAFT_417370 [Aulographum hederae CBS 113979]|uniref:[histone H3]-trimethyl-L-lysine(9) demethylase n=1 Tax=Aulographum hederae CBS 113979 TaxID=1176131 RepID=A0A6G1HBH5_9PEZI|nr:hypothetical protein K402DRAFT_417370 [Aulographum hederae CBS 113979]
MSEPAAPSMATVESIERPEAATASAPAAKAALTPPTSEDMDKRDSTSDLSELDLDDEDDIGEVEPDHYYEGGRIPVFKPTMDQFRSFKKFVDKIDKYGMKSGIVKIIPPQEWRNSLPALDDAVKTIKVKNPITQEFSGTHGTYTQQNIEKQRSYNLPQWKALTEESNHQPPLRRGEKRRNVETPAVRARPRPQPTPLPNGEKRRPGRPRKKQLARQQQEDEEQDNDEEAHDTSQVPPTPTSPETKPAKVAKKTKEDTPTKAKGRQPKSKNVEERKTISERRKYNSRDVAGEVDEEAFKDFQYKLAGIDEYTAERCHELEENYWKTLNYGTPMYGADMPGSLFPEKQDVWNVAKLENLLDVLGTKVPGVNTTYLYLGMWKATFAWHLEDVDLYSINYIHFGAPKQWYSISQEDARRFEAAMKSIWPDDAKHCSQFLRHKTYLISPEKLRSQFNIKVNKLVHHEGEFVITYPYGYHSGYNLGYNCAESVNFATETWLDYGRIAKKCNCEADSVWVDVSEIERKLRGEPTPEYYEETDEEEEDDLTLDLPSPPASVAGKPKAAPRKRKRATDTKAEVAPAKAKKKIKVRVRIPSKEPCILCPNEASYDTLLPSDNGQKVHRLCALYTPETFLVENGGVEKVHNVTSIDKARLDLKCNFCRSKRGACFQCSSKKCTRAFHATCAAAAGVQIDIGPVPTWDEDGTEYYCEGYDFRCKFHRPKRGKNVDGEALEKSKLISDYAVELKKDDVVQVQYLGSDIFSGSVVENRPNELSVLIQVEPTGDRVEVEWKYLLVLDPADSLRPKPSPTAKPLPQHLNNNKSINASNRIDGPPEMEEPFNSDSSHKWAEFHTCTVDEASNPHQVKIDMSKPEKLWFYMGNTSTEAKAQYCGDPAKPIFDQKSVFLDTVKPASQPRPAFQTQRNSFTSPWSNQHSSVSQQPRMLAQAPRPGEKPYEYKPRPDAQRYNAPLPPNPYQPPGKTNANQQYGYGGPTSQQYHSRYPDNKQANRAVSASHQPQQRPSDNRQYFANPQQNYHHGPTSNYQPPAPPKTNVPRYGLSEEGKRMYKVPALGYPDAIPPAVDPQLEQTPSYSGFSSLHQNYYPQQIRDYQYPSYHSHPSPASASQRAAPVANMTPAPTSISPPYQHGRKPSTPRYPSPPTARAAPSAYPNGQNGTRSSDFKAQPGTPSKSPPEKVEVDVAHLQHYPYLMRSYCRRPKTYTSPYSLGGGYTLEYLSMKSQAKAAQQASSRAASGNAGSTTQRVQPPQQYPNPHSVSTPSYQAHHVPAPPKYPYQHQTEQDFRQNLSKAEAPGMTKFDQLMKQLNSPAPPQDRSMTPTGSPPNTLHVQQYPQRPSPSQQSRPKTPPGGLGITAPNLDPMLADQASIVVQTPANAHRRSHTPTRPDYSPLSDHGIPNTTDGNSLPPLSQMKLPPIGEMGKNVHYAAAYPEVQSHPYHQYQHGQQLPPVRPAYEGMHAGRGNEQSGGYPPMQTQPPQAHPQPAGSRVEGWQ